MKLPERSRLPDNLEIPGLYPPRRHRLPSWPLGLWLVVLVVAAIPAVGIPGIVLAHYTTSSPAFCLSCHGTGDTPDRSVPSEVHPSFDKVSCVDCHAKPGQVVFEGYVKGFLAEPERITINCLRCHSAMSERTDQQGFKFNVRTIIINHQAHIQRGAGCVSCHANVAHDLEVPKTNRPRMESCYSCHPRTDSCTKCHAGGIPQATPARETIGRRPVAASAPAPAAAANLPVATAAAQTAPPAPPTATKAAAQASTAEGKTLFAQTCAMCHGADGSSIPSANLKSKAYLDGLGAAGLAQTTAEGNGGMPPFGTAKGGPLKDDQIKAIVAYLMSVAN
ncbi:MAG: c-type cytochrome [Chloroflexi bacterium]|nr:c-type cytochrome [Chloroflexota bacterium]